MNKTQRKLQERRAAEEAHNRMIVEAMGNALLLLYKDVVLPHSILYEPELGTRFLLDNPVQSLPLLDFAAVRMTKVPPTFGTGMMSEEAEAGQEAIFLRDGWSPNEIDFIRTQLVEKIRAILVECDAYVASLKLSSEAEANAERIAQMNRFYAENTYFPFVNVPEGATLERRVSFACHKSRGTIYALATRLPALHSDDLPMVVAYLEQCTMILAEGLRVTSLQTLYYDYRLQAEAQTIVLFFCIPSD